MSDNPPLPKPENDLARYRIAASGSLRYDRRTHSKDTPTRGDHTSLQHRAQGHGCARVNNHLVLAIICTLLCCLPMGIVAIVYAAKVNTLARGGNMSGACDVSEKAKFWAVLGIVLGAMFWFFAVALQLLRSGHAAL